MRLYRIRQHKNSGYDTYDSAVVVAESEDDAVKIHPMLGYKWDGVDEKYSTWTDPSHVIATEIGIAHSSVIASHPDGVVCASFNAG